MNKQLLYVLPDAPDMGLSMLQAGVEADTAIQNSVMRVAKQQGQSPAQLEEYLTRLHKLGLKPDEQTFNVLLRAYLAHGNLSEALRILERMATQGLGTCCCPVAQLCLPVASCCHICAHAHTNYVVVLCLVLLACLDVLALSFCSCSQFVLADLHLAT